VPSIKNTIDFIKNLTDQICNGSTNVVIHCMGGKGRSGTIASILLLYSGICKTSEVNYNELQETKISI
jgi:protein-tyrosine phosphatase